MISTVFLHFFVICKNANFDFICRNCKFFRFFLLRALRCKNQSSTFIAFDIRPCSTLGRSTLGRSTFGTFDIQLFDIWTFDIRTFDIGSFNIRDVQHSGCSTFSNLTLGLFYNIRHSVVRHSDIRHSEIRHSDVRHSAVEPNFHPCT
jgi:hypothetical protein